MEFVVSQLIEDELIQIDLKHFVDCTLVNCTLEYSGEDVIFERTAMHGCRHIFYGRARQTIHYLQGTGLMPYTASDWGELCSRLQ